MKDKVERGVKQLLRENLLLCRSINEGLHIIIGENQVLESMHNFSKGHFGALKGHFGAVRYEVTHAFRDLPVKLCIFHQFRCQIFFFSLGCGLSLILCIKARKWKEKEYSTLHWKIN